MIEAQLLIHAGHRFIFVPAGQLPINQETRSFFHDCLPRHVGVDAVAVIQYEPDNDTQSGTTESELLALLPEVSAQSLTQIIEEIITIRPLFHPEQYTLSIPISIPMITRTNYTSELQEIITRATDCAYQMKSSHISPLHYLLTLLISSDLVNSMLYSANINGEQLINQTTDMIVEMTRRNESLTYLSIPNSRQVREVFNTTEAEAFKDNDLVSVEHLLLALVTVPTPAQNILLDAGLTPTKMYDLLEEFDA